ncbi:MAG: hypothetical protein SGILL_005649, partial [Bacillariaceae sp.]
MQEEAFRTVKGLRATLTSMKMVVKVSSDTKLGVKAAAFVQLFLTLGVAVSPLRINLFTLFEGLSIDYADVPTLEEAFPENERLAYWPQEMQEWEMTAINIGMCSPPDG